MKEFMKAIEDYKKWKLSIRKVLDDNFNEINSLLIDAYGQDTLIGLRVQQQQFPQYNQYSSQSIVSGFVVNIESTTGEYLLWYYENGAFHLIQRNSESNLLNIKPYFYDQTGSFHRSPAYKARFESEINFILDLIDFSDAIVQVLKQRMESLKASDAQEMIQKLTSVV